MSEREPTTSLEELDARLKSARGENAEGDPAKRRDPPPQNALGVALRIGVELVSALAVGVGIGWVLDRWLGTRPWLMLVFILLGGAAGILNVYRMARGFGYGVGYRRKNGGDTDAGT